ncbi:SAM-dependent methyltransferase [Chroococcidiopsis sp. CCALA 051]|uniref:class I SAM-dependent methyltransferase n=1 Tax=Chroococcidiopsis sp. CCALA 051 TaxID=869949 RepID=UPI000D0D6336|nr:methyltransferase domain-containing protein [Chroococcidiopsis sp. CCALA 051]MBE9015528.1 class I SAM-dependent methyltransferase [Chroococcidiopsidales cyanobacterium LEGE 13417]PSM46235.1 SAM-dependent methyltransferase [Chroococcidiopsis sp. CCALA 051]
MTNDQLQLIKMHLKTRISSFLRITCGLCLIVCCLGFNVSSAAADVATQSNPINTKVYEYRSPSADGIGKFYLGREIAKVMGHTGSLWLERPSREREEQPTKAIAALDLKPTDVVADIGAGTGYFSFRLAKVVPQGKVFAVDVQPEMLDIIEFLKQENKITNVEPVLGAIANPNLPTNSIDLALMVDAYHEFSHPNEMMKKLVKSLKPAGRVVLVEYRRENPFIPIKTLHKMTQKQARKEMQAIGLQWQTTKDVLPSQHIMIFTKGNG